MKEAHRLLANSAWERPRSLCHFPLPRSSQKRLGNLGEAMGYLVSTRCLCHNDESRKGQLPQQVPKRLERLALLMSREGEPQQFGETT